MDAKNSLSMLFEWWCKCKRAKKPYDCHLSGSYCLDVFFKKWIIAALLLSLCSCRPYSRTYPTVCSDDCSDDSARCATECMEPPSSSMRYVYKEGPVQLRNEEAYMVESDTGPAILNWAKVTYEVITKGIDAVNSDLGALQIKGNAWIRKSTIRGNSCICGNARFCDSCIQGDSWVGGEVHADSSSFKGTLCLCGNLTARHTEFSGDISAAANVITFSNTCAGTIHVSNTLTYCYDWQILILKNGSHVDSVIFDSQRGRVLCDKTSCCGEIVGGCRLSPHAGILTSPREFQ